MCPQKETYDLLTFMSRTHAHDAHLIAHAAGFISEIGLNRYAVKVAQADGR